MRGRMRHSERAIGHFRNYSDVELRAKAEAAGLRVVDIFGWGFPFYSPLYRTVIEWLPRGPPKGNFDVIANFLYWLYAFNIPRRGDVVIMLVRHKDPDRSHNSPYANEFGNAPTRWACDSSSIRDVTEKRQEDASRSELT